MDSNSKMIQREEGKEEREEGKEGEIKGGESKGMRPMRDQSMQP